MPSLILDYYPKQKAKKVKEGRQFNEKCEEVD